MHYNLVFEKVDVELCNKDCPYEPKEDDYEIHLLSIIEDIKSIDGVIDANLLADGSVHVVTKGIAREIFKEKLSPFLSEHFCYLRLSLNSI